MSRAVMTSPGVSLTSVCMSEERLLTLVMALPKRKKVGHKGRP
jgi:hypothetical protein